MRRYEVEEEEEEEGLILDLSERGKRKERHSSSFNGQIGQRRLGALRNVSAYVIHTCIDRSSGVRRAHRENRHTSVFAHRWLVLFCPAVHHWQIFYLAAAARRLLLVNYAAAGPCNKLQADSTPCVCPKI